MIARTAIVTGAGKRIGAEIARALADDGWSVVAHVRRPDDRVIEGAVKVAADLEQRDCAVRIFAAAEGLPPVQLLVNNAARFAWDGFGEVDAAEFDAHMAVNVRGPLLLIDEFARRFATGADGSVINLLDSKLAAPNPDFLSYTISKQALAGVTELAARALASKGIRVNAIAPALTLRSPGQSDANFKAMHAANPLGRGVDPSDVVQAVRYLADERTVGGAVLTLDGGERVLSLERDVEFLGKP